MSRQYLFHFLVMDGIVEGWMALWKDGWMDGILEGWMELWKDGWNFPLAAFGGWRLYNQGRIWQILFEPTDMITLIIFVITIVIINRSQVKR